MSRGQLKSKLKQQVTTLGRCTAASKVCPLPRARILVSWTPSHTSRRVLRDLVPMEEGEVQYKEVFSQNKVVGLS